MVAFDVGRIPLLAVLHMVYGVLRIEEKMQAWCRDISKIKMAVGIWSGSDADRNFDVILSIE